MVRTQIKEILQKEWGYLTREDLRETLATPNVKWCTAFYGTDKKKNIGFMCHFDLPCSTKSLPELFKVLERHIPKKRKIICYIDGGYWFTYSFLTRAKIIKYIRKCNSNGWNIQLINKPYNVQLCPMNVSLGKGIQYRYKQDEITDYPMNAQIRTKGRTFKNSVLRCSARLSED